MNIVLIHGQNHKGSSYHSGRLLAEQFSKSEISEFFLPKDLEHFCLGCYNCIENEEKCPFYAEKKRIMDEVEKADLLIFTTPTYCMRASAPMKAFMDLTFTYWMVHKPRECMFAKKAVVISTAAGSGMKTAIKDGRCHKYAFLLGRALCERVWGSRSSYELGASLGREKENHK